MVSRFRLVLAASAILYVWVFSISYAKQPQEVREALAYAGRGAVLPVTATVPYLFLVAYLIATAGLLAWKNWARRLFLIVLVAGIIMRPLRGVSVSPPFNAFLGSIFGVLTGVILAVIYLPPLAAKFVSERAEPEESLSPELPAPDVSNLSEIEAIWRVKSDDEISEAALNLGEYTEEAAGVIRGELQRRGLPEPKRDVIATPDQETRCVFVASGLDEANQIIAFLESAGISSALRGESTTKTHGFTVDGLGRLEIQIGRAHV